MGSEAGGFVPVVLKEPHPIAFCWACRWVWGERKIRMKKGKHVAKSVMSKTAFSIRALSIYMLTLGLILVTVPNLLLSVFGIPETQEIWIHVVGLLVFIIGYFNFMASRYELVLFFHWTVPARILVAVFFVTVVILKLAPPVLLLFGIIDFASATWTVVCLRADGSFHSGPERCPSTHD